MPVIKSAVKKLRKDRKREKVNDAFRKNLEKAIKTARKTRSKSDVSAAFSVIDKAVKNHVMHKNKAARIKSALSKDKGRATAQPVAKKETPKTVVKTTSAKKSASKKSPIKTKK